MKRILCIVFAMCLISMGACNTINSFNGNDGFESLPNISNEIVINEEHINKTEEPKQEDNKTDELIHGITPVEYLNKDNISEYRNLTEDQKIAFEFLITVHKDIIETGPVANKTYSLPRRMEWLDYKTARNLFCANFTALENLTLPLCSLESQGTREYVDKIYLHDVDERDEEYHREFLALDTRANDILSEIEHDGTEYGKALAIAKWMTDNIDYAHDYKSRGEDNLGTAYTALMTGEAICDGYRQTSLFRITRTEVTCQSNSFRQ